MEAERSSETSVKVYKTIRRHIPQYNILHSVNVRNMLTTFLFHSTLFRNHSSLQSKSVITANIYISLRISSTKLGKLQDTQFCPALFRIRMRRLEVREIASGFSKPAHGAIRYKTEPVLISWIIELGSLNLKIIIIFWLTVFSSCHIFEHFPFSLCFNDLWAQWPHPSSVQHNF
jgi:hypothetical protein